MIVFLSYKVLYTFIATGFYLFVSEIFDLKMKYDESDNVLIRGTRFFTDKISSVFGKFVIFTCEKSVE